jgi:hypothetical protein
MKTILLFTAGIIAATFSYGGDKFSITFNNFNGVLMNQHIDLSWATMMESGVDHFEIQRSDDGLNFQNIDSVESKMQITTNAYQLQYNYSDEHPLAGISYYRIEVIGKNGNTTQSTIIEINNNTIEGTRIYPTVTQNNIVFIESGKDLRAVKMEFYDLSGRKISETDWATLSGRQSAEISKSGVLPAGTYVARITAGGEPVKSQLLIVQNH